jgi:hypothetical protein
MKRVASRVGVLGSDGRELGSRNSGRSGNGAYVTYSGQLCVISADVLRRAKVKGKRACLQLYP